MNTENNIPKFEGTEELDPTFTTRDANDIDIFDLYDELKKKYPNDGKVKISNEMENSAFFELQEAVFVKSLIDQGIDLSKEQAVRGYVVPSSFYSYMPLLAWKILLISPYKIGELLSYQSKQYLGNSIALKDNFLGLVNVPVFQFVEGFVNAHNLQNENIRLDKITEWLDRNKLLKEETTNIQNPGVPGKNYLLRIPTNATSEQILNFWLELQGNNKKGDPFWENEEEIEHFVNQNFEGFEGVDEIKEFNPNMNKTKLSSFTHGFFNKYGIYGTKPQYVKLLQENFTKFKGDKENSTYTSIANR